MRRKKCTDNHAAKMRQKFADGRGRPRRWTEDQLAYIRANAATTQRAEMCAHLACDPRVLSKLLKKMGLDGLRNPPAWSDRETEILRSMAPTHYATPIARALNRDVETVTKEAKRLGITLRSWIADCAAQREEYARMAGEGLTVKEMAARTGKRYGAVLNMLQQLGLKAAPDPRARTPRPKTAKGDKPKPKPVKQSPEPRERIGLARAVRRFTYHGNVEWCQRCHAPVVNTPQAWAEHNLRLHAGPPTTGLRRWGGFEPIRRIA